MSKPVTPADSRHNLAIVQGIIDDFPKETSGAVGIHALAQLADLMPSDQFLNFVHDALHHATTGQMPQPEEQQPEEGQLS